VSVLQSGAPIIGLAAGGLVFLATLLRLQDTSELRAVLLVSAVWGLIVWGIMRVTAWITQDPHIHPSSRIDDQGGEDAGDCST
jgi:hypothetical protein